MARKKKEVSLAPYSMKMCKDLHHRMDVYCAQNGITMTWWVQGLIRQALDKIDAKPQVAARRPQPAGKVMVAPEADDNSYDFAKQEAAAKMEGFEAGPKKYNELTWEEKTPQQRAAEKKNIAIKKHRADFDAGAIDEDEYQKRVAKAWAVYKMEEQA